MSSEEGRTHVDLVCERVVYDFEEAHDVGVIELLHDGDLLENLHLCVAELVYEGQVRRWWEGPFPELVKPLLFFVLSFHDFDRLQHVEHTSTA